MAERNEFVFLAGDSTLHSQVHGPGAGFDESDPTSIKVGIANSGRASAHSATIGAHVTALQKMDLPPRPEESKLVVVLKYGYNDFNNLDGSATRTPEELLTVAKEFLAEAQPSCVVISSVNPNTTWMPAGVSYDFNNRIYGLEGELGIPVVVDDWDATVLPTLGGDGVHSNDPSRKTHTLESIDACFQRLKGA